MWSAALPIIVCLFMAGVYRGVMAKNSPVPHYKVDASWPKELPNNWTMGQVSDMYVDHSDHIWILQRPKSNAADEIGATDNVDKGHGDQVRLAMCCVPAPPVIVFDKEGNVLKSWGGPGPGYDWPASEHGIIVQRNGNVWISGAGNTDRQLLEFTNDGKFIREIGHPFNGPPNSADKTTVGKVAGFDLDEDAHELYVADGYWNKRVVVFDTDTGAFKRMWGAYGHVPDDADPGPYKYKENDPDQQFRNPVHCVHLSKDGMVYVCDRNNDRIQVFTKQGNFLKEFFVHPITSGSGTVCDLTFSHDPDQAYLLVADVTNDVIWELRRSDGMVVGMFGHQGRNAGQFSSLHEIQSDSAGNLYTGEVANGKRVQKFLLASGK